MDNYFKLLGVKEHFDIDLKMLHNNFIDLQRRYHPDVINEIESQGEDFLSSKLNRAFEILSDDIKRSEYLLSLNNIFLEKNTSQDFLSEEELSYIWGMFESFEKLENLKDKEDFLNELLSCRKEKILFLRKAYKINDINLAAKTTVELRYIESLINNLRI